MPLKSIFRSCRVQRMTMRSKNHTVSSKPQCFPSEEPRILARKALCLIQMTTYLCHIRKFSSKWQFCFLSFFLVNIPSHIISWMKGSEGLQPQVTHSSPKFAVLEQFISIQFSFYDMPAVHTPYVILCKDLCQN